MTIPAKAMTIVMSVAELGRSFRKIQARPAVTKGIAARTNNVLATVVWVSDCKNVIAAAASIIPAIIPDHPTLITRTMVAPR